MAIIAATLQSAWEILPATANGSLPKHEALVRCLLIGGGGCGKTQIINRVLRPLFSAFFGPNAVQTQAPSNKAARQIHGKTTHTVNKLRVESSLLTVHLRLTSTTRTSLELSTVRRSLWVPNISPGSWRILEDYWDVLLVLDHRMS